MSASRSHLARTLAAATEEHVRSALTRVTTRGAPRDAHATSPPAPAGSLPSSLSGKAFAVAYEPVWAIGTGLTPTLEQIEEVHAAVRAAMIVKLGEGGRTAPILYGGSVKPSNAAEILAVAEVGGALVGGASLKAEDFLGIIRAV